MWYKRTKDRRGLSSAVCGHASSSLEIRSSGRRAESFNQTADRIVDADAHTDALRLYPCCRRRQHHAAHLYCASCMFADCRSLASSTNWNTSSTLAAAAATATVTELSSHWCCCCGRYQTVATSLFQRNNNTDASHRRPRWPAWNVLFLCLLLIVYHLSIINCKT